MEKSYLDSDAFGPADKEYTESKARKVCIASLILRYVVPPLALIFSVIPFLISAMRTMNQAESEPVPFPVFQILLMYISYFSSWVLMIRVRLRRKEYRFGNILKWLYIGDTALVILYLIINLIVYFIKAGVLS